MNDPVWVPYFGLPTVYAHSRAAEEGTIIGDNYMEETFLNFKLDEGIRPYVGHELAKMLSNENLSGMVPG